MTENEMQSRLTRQIIKALLAVTEQMAAQIHSKQTCGAIANELRDCADRIERLERAVV